MKIFVIKSTQQLSLPFVIEYSTEFCLYILDNLAKAFEDEKALKQKEKVSWT